MCSHLNRKGILDELIVENATSVIKKSLHNINIFKILDIFHFLNSYWVFHTLFKVTKLKSSAFSQMPKEQYPEGWVELVAITVSGNYEFPAIQ